MPDVFEDSDDFERWFSAPLGTLREKGGSGSGRGSRKGGGEGAEDVGGREGGSEASMLSQEEYLLVTNRLHQVRRRGGEQSAWDRALQVIEPCRCASGYLVSCAPILLTLTKPPFSLFPFPSSHLSLDPYPCPPLVRSCGPSCCVA